MTTRLGIWGHLELLNINSPILVNWSRKRTRMMPNFREQYQPKINRAARAKHNSRIEIVNRAKDSRSRSNVQLIDSSQEGQTRLRALRRRRPNSGIRARRTWAVAS